MAAQNEPQDSNARAKGRFASVDAGCNPHGPSLRRWPTASTLEILPRRVRHCPRLPRVEAGQGERTFPGPWVALGHSGQRHHARREQGRNSWPPPLAAGAQASRNTTARVNVADGRPAPLGQTRLGGGATAEPGHFLPLLPPMDPADLAGSTRPPPNFLHFPTHFMSEQNCDRSLARFCRGAFYPLFTRLCWGFC
jgi:hypothetical protein